VSFLRTELPIPPSSNAIYRRRGNRPGLYLTPEASRYRRLATKQLLENHAVDVQKLDAHVAYRLVLVFHLQALNKGWPKTAKSRYKRVDLSNRIKLLEDVIKDVTGIDDSQTFEITVVKKHLEQGSDPRVQVLFEVLEEGEWLDKPR